MFITFPGGFLCSEGEKGEKPVGVVVVVSRHLQRVTQTDHPVALLLSSLLPRSHRPYKPDSLSLLLLPLSHLTMSTTPTRLFTARISTLQDWFHCFDYTHGVFRTSLGEHIDHLDVDLRFVDHDARPRPSGSPMIRLPNVRKLTLRGGEYVQDSDDRMERLAEVMFALTPLEVRW
jgi:hypothetical protein